MKLKCRPEDFRVDELSDVTPGDGPFAFYRLTKRSLGTPEVIDAIVQRYGIARARISFGGLKDRHALTVQHLTIERGPRRHLKQSKFTLDYVGQVGRPFTPRDIRANRFSIVMRDMSKIALAHASEALAEVSRDRLPNYFDDQRFGSLGASGEFIARPWCEERYERALWLAFAEANEHDRPEDRRVKALLREKWGDWSTLKGELPRSHLRSIVTFLVDRPGDYKGALARVHKEQRTLWLAAYQSYLWNRLLMAFLRGQCAPSQLVPLGTKSDTLLFYRSVDDRQRTLLTQASLPLPSARTPPGPYSTLLDQVLSDEGLTLRKLRIKHPKDCFFSKGERAATVAPEKLTHQSAPDELYAGHHALSLTFELPRGAYATILVKRISAIGPPS